MFDRMKTLSLSLVAATLVFAAAAPTATPASALPRGPVAEGQAVASIGFRRHHRGVRHGFRRDRRARRYLRFNRRRFYDWKDLPKQCRKFWWLYQNTGKQVYYWKYRQCVRRYTW